MYRKRYSMESDGPRSSEQQQGEEEQDTLKLFAVKTLHKTGTIEQKAIKSLNATITAKGSSEATGEPQGDSREAIDTRKTSATPEMDAMATIPVAPMKAAQQSGITRGKALLGIGLLLVVALSAINTGYAQFIGPQGWAFVIGGPAGTGNNNLL